MSKTLNVTKQAYKKSFLHSFKYANEDIIGLLSGTIDGNGYQINDAFPLFHSKVLQAPLEVALDLIQANLNKGEQIIGVYESRVSKTGDQPQSDIAHELIETLASQLGKQEPIYLKIVEIEDEDEISTKLIAKFWAIQSQLKMNPTSELDYTVIEEALEQGQHWKIIDMDAHLENVSLDFTNKYLND